MKSLVNYLDLVNTINIKLYSLIISDLFVITNFKETIEKNELNKLYVYTTTRHFTVLAAGDRAHVVHDLDTAVDCTDRHRRQRSRGAGHRNGAGKAAHCGHAYFSNLLRDNLRL